MSTQPPTQSVTPAAAPQADSHTPYKPTPRRRMMHRVRWLALGLALIWFAWFAYPRLTLRPTPRQDYWLSQIIELDPPRDGAISTSQAHALLEQLMIACRSLPPAFADRVPDARWQGAWDFRRRPGPEADRLFTSQEYVSARSALRDALVVGWREPLGPEVKDIDPENHRYLYTRWCESLLVHSRWARQRQESTKETQEDWLIALRLGRQLARAHTADYLAIASQIHQEVAREMIYTSYDTHGSINTRSLMENIDAILGPLLKPSVYLEGERLWLHALLENVYVREGGDWLAVSEVRAVAPNLRGRHFKPAPRIWNLASPFFHDLSSARRRVDLYFEAANGATCLNDCSMSRLDLRDKCTALGSGSADGLPRYNNYDILEMACTQYVARCTLDAAVTMLALHEFRRRHGEYPESLDMLVPELLPRLPIDYADLGTLRYRRDKEAYVLYSLGFSDVDNGGQGAKSFSRYNGSGDVVFTDWGRN